MVHIAGRWVIAGWLLIVGVIGAEQVRAQTITERREAAVLQARAGHLEAAIGHCARCWRPAKTTVSWRWTLLRCCSRPTGQARPSLSSKRRLVAEPPDYALLAATRAYRDLRRYRDAEKLARQGLKRFPDQTVWPLLLALVLDRRGPSPGSARSPEPARGAARAAGRTASGGGLCLAQGGRPVQGDCPPIPTR